MKKSELKKIIREEMGMLNENEDIKFVQAAIKEFSKVNRINISSYNIDQYRDGKRMIYTVHITDKLSKIRILLNLFDDLFVQFSENETDESMVYSVSLKWSIKKNGSGNTDIATIHVDKQTGRVQYKVRL